jgi:hypothetical protein
LNLCGLSGAATIKIISSTSKISISGVILMSGLVSEVFCIFFSSSALLKLDTVSRKKFRLPGSAGILPA